MKYLTWLDVERVIRTHASNRNFTSQGVNSILCFSDGVEISVSSPSVKAIVIEIFKGWFGDWLQLEPLGVVLDIGDSLLPIHILVEDDLPKQQIINRPLWSDVAYVKGEEQEYPSFVSSPLSFDGKASVTAFHSFKGGVGRTTTMITFVAAILDKCKSMKKRKKILLVDADLEAPGITYWFKDSQLPEVSFITFLEAMHYPPKSLDSTLEFFGKELRRTSLSFPEAEIFFLPASLNEAQLLDTPVLPEHISRSGSYPWMCADYIYNLGKVLEVDHIMIDLRAGLSEISSPLLFDPRVERFFVTTVSEQSVRGTSFVLNKISDFNSSNNWIAAYKEARPNIILNLLTKEIFESDLFDSAMTRLQSSYTFDDSEDSLSPGLNIFTSSFAQTLMSFSDWEDALEKIKSSDLLAYCHQWVDDKNLSFESGACFLGALNSKFSNDCINSLAEICKKYEYAEKGESVNLLLTEPVRAMAKHFFDKLPSIVSIGAKGAGKTFNFLQLSAFVTWDKFLAKVGGSESEYVSANIFPLLQSANLEEKALAVTERARTDFHQHLGVEHSFSPTHLRSIIEDAVVKHEFVSKLDWTSFWIRQMSGACCLPDNDKIDTLNEFLISKGVQVVFIFDGIEDTFRDIGSNEHEQQAVSALLEIPNKIGELRNRALGTVIFLREDYLKAVIKQNIGQFVSRYNAYQLIWDADSFLKLVYWICTEADVIDAKKHELDILSRTEILQKLECLWGRKLGGEKEANTASWIYAALTDLKGRLQARDVIRLLRFASEKSLIIPSKNRETLLSPQAIRNALVPCSSNKVEEAKQEYIVFRKWVDQLTKVDPSLKKIPFDPVTVGLDSTDLETLKDIGVVFEDKDREDKARFYIPEIYRSGLGFRLDKGARPRVLVLQKRAIGNNLL